MMLMIRGNSGNIVSKYWFLHQNWSWAGICLLQCMEESTSVMVSRLMSFLQNRSNIWRNLLWKGLLGEWISEAGVVWRIPMIPGLSRYLSWQILYCLVPRARIGQLYNTSHLRPPTIPLVKGTITITSYHIIAYLFWSRLYYYLFAVTWIA